MFFKNNPVVYLTKKTWEYSKGNRGNVILYGCLFLVANAINFFEPLVVAFILNMIQERGVNAASLPSLIAGLSLFIILSVSFWIFHGPARVIERKNAFLVRANYKKHLLEGTMNLPAQWHTDHHSGDTIDKIEKGTYALYRYSGSTFEVIETIMRLIGSYFALVYFNLHASYIILFMIIITLNIILRFDKYLMKLYKKLFHAENRISAKIYDIISNITTVIILRVEKLVSRSIVKKIMYPFYTYTRSSKISEFKWFLVSFCSSIMIFLVLASYIYFNVRKGSVVMIGTVYALYGYVQRISGIFYRFAYRYGEIVREGASVKNAEEISDEFKEKKKVKEIDLGGRWKELRIENLNFSYHARKGSVLHLDNISLSIKRKEKIALVGESGSGKTTILKVMRELYEPKNVKVYLDGELLKDDFKAISSDITLVPQDPEIFSTTIKENITLGINHRLDYIKKFTNMACFTDVVNSLPKKFNSSIVEKGVNLSTGEKQRLALARGLMACEDKAIILLDEPTSSVDSKNELQIYHNIFKKFKRKTIISSIHRLHLLHLFDKIYYFKNGKIIASGTFRGLLKTSKEFKKLWEKYNRTEEMNKKK